MKLMIITAALIFSCVFARAQAPDLPKQTDDFVDDFAGVMAATDRASVIETLSKILAVSGEHVCFVTVSSTAETASGYDVEALASAFYDAWRINEKSGKGMLILISIKDRSAALELGSGDKSMYGRVMNDVVGRHMLPDFKEGDYGRGIYEGAMALSALLRQPPAFSWKLSNTTLLVIGLILLAAAGFYFIRLAVTAPPAQGKKIAAPGMDKIKEKNNDFGGGAAGSW